MQMPLRSVVCLLLLVVTWATAAVPPGYRYIGSRVVSEGRHVYWYWNVGHVQVAAQGNAFVARMHARNVELDQERSFVAIVRCDTRTYRRVDVQEPYQPIDDDDDPIHTVWRAGCDGERAAAPASLVARLDGATASSAPPVPEIG